MVDAAASSPILLALDWTPNTNHTGFYVARAKGFYADAGLPEVKFRSPHVDGYKATNPSLLMDRTATFAIGPTESVISYHTWPGGVKPKIVGVAAVLQGSTSAIVTPKSSGITRPAELDGKVYASYGARYEGRIVQQMIRNDGGKGDFKETTPEMLGIWNTILKGDADATWVFMGWEGVEAEMKGVELNVFHLEDYSIPYPYAPLMMAHPDTLKEQPDVVKAFLSASCKGFQYAAAHPEEAAQILLDEVDKEADPQHPLPVPLEPEMVKKAQVYASKYYLNQNGEWGVMEESRWAGFLDWLSESGLLTSKVQSRAPGLHATSLDGLRQGDVGEKLSKETLILQDMYTNDFLPQKA